MLSSALFHVLQVLEMFILVLQQCHKENEDKWKRLSRQVADVILPMIAKQQVGNHIGCNICWLVLTF